MINLEDRITDEEVNDIKFFYQTCIYNAMNYKKDKEALYYLDVKKEVIKYRGLY